MQIPPSQKDQADRRRRVISVLVLLAFALVILFLGYYLGKPLMDLIRDRRAFRSLLEESGPLKYLLMIGLMMLQVIVAVIPGGPIEVAAGYAFGPWMGTALCVIGGALASAAIFLFVRAFGLKLVYMLVPQKQLESLRFLRDRKKLYALMAIIFFVPGLPKDVLTYLAGVTPISFSAFMMISTLGRTPSIFVSAAGGHRLSEGKYLAGAIILAVLLVVTLVASLVYRRHTQKPKKDALDKELDGDGGIGEPSDAQAVRPPEAGSKRLKTCGDGPTKDN